MDAVAIEKMKKVLIAGLGSDFRPVAKKLQSMSIIHMVRVEDQVEGLSADKDASSFQRSEELLSRAKGALAFLSKYNPHKKGFLSPRPELGMEELSEMQDSVLTTICAQSERLEEGLSQVRTQRVQAQNTIEQLKPYEELDIPVEQVRNSKYTRMFLGSIPQDQREELETGFAEIQADIRRLGEQEDSFSYFIVCHAAMEEEAKSILRLCGFADANLGIKGRVSDSIQVQRGRIAELDKQEEELQQEAREISQDVPKLQVYVDKCTIQRDEDGLIDQAGMTEKAFFLSGWIRERDFEALQEALQRVSEDLLVEIVEPMEGEIPPTAVKNSKLLKPFEAVTDMYSTPNQAEIDPTPVMAPFFFMFFGIMVSDAGYGIVLTLLTLFFLKKAKPRGMMGQITAILAMGGISTVIWGAIFGGWFGESLLPPLWFIPMDEPIMMMALCLAIGVVHISVGLLTRFFMLCRAKDYVSAICDVLFLLLILWGAPLVLLGVSAGGYMAIAGAVGMLLTAGREKPGILKKLMGGFSSLYGLTGYISDILSYARLFGLGLATGVIGMVFNTLATMVMGNPIGIVLGIVILLVGHTFNLGINALGAYVHSCRLQYIEFYSKFFEGGGRAFVPFGYKTKYIYVKGE